MLKLSETILYANICSNTYAVSWHVTLQWLIWTLIVKRRITVDIPWTIIFCLKQYLSKQMFNYYCKTRFFRVPFILRISRAWQVRENNGPQKLEYSSVSV